MDIHLKISVPVYLKKFLQVQFGNSYTVKQTDWFGILLVGQLQKKSSAYYSYKKASNDIAVNSYDIIIPSHSAFKNWLFLIKQNENKLINAVDDIFRKQIYYQAIFNQIHYNIEYQTTIKNILESYGIEEDELQYETLRKDFSRNKTEIEKKINELP